MWINEDMSCCGVKEIAALSEHRTAEDAMKGFIEETNMLGHRRFRYAIFTAAGGPRTKYGTNFAAYILENKLGTIIETERNKNPNSGNMLKVWVWTIDHIALVKWEKKHMPPEEGWVRAEVVDPPRSTRSRS